MRREAEISEFYGVEVSEYNVNPLKLRNIDADVLAKVNQSTAHIVAHAFQNGYNIPSDSRIVKTIRKNKDGIPEPTVYRLDKASNRYRYYNSFTHVFRKEKKDKLSTRAPAKAQAKKIEAFEVHSPEQIVIKCARQAYVRQLLQKDKSNLKIEEKVENKQISESLKKRKEHQKKRREERTLLLKAYKDWLFNIFGKIIFTKGWRISRNELKEKLQMEDQCFSIEYMRGIIQQRQARAAITTMIYLEKKKAYQKQRLERLKILKYLRKFEKNNYVPHCDIKYPHKQEDLYEIKRQYAIKSKEAHVEGEQMKRLRRRKMKKQKNYFRQNDCPNSKQLQKQANESTLDIDEVDECQEDYDQTYDVAQAQQKDTDKQTIQE